MMVDVSLGKSPAGSVVFVASDGTARLTDEADRVDAVKALGRVPAGCGPEIPCAPARGPVRVSDPVECVGGALRPAGYEGRSMLKCADVFDLMDQQARRVFARRKSQDADAVYEEPFNAGQVSVARHYAGLFEGLECGQIGGSAFSDRVSGGSGGLDAVDLRLAARQEFKGLEDKIGRGVALAMRKVRPSKRGDGRVCKSITDIDAARLVCLHGKSLTEVLRKYDWTVSTLNLRALRAALRGSMDRMQDYGGEK